MGYKILGDGMSSSQKKDEYRVVKVNIYGGASASIRQVVSNPSLLPAHLQRFFF